MKQSTNLPSPSTINIHITDSLIPAIFHNSDASSKLSAISLSNLSQHQFTFYTDGSVKQLGTNQCSMGIGWVQVYNDQII